MTTEPTPSTFWAKSISGEMGHLHLIEHYLKNTLAETTSALKIASDGRNPDKPHDAASLHAGEVGALSHMMEYVQYLKNRQSESERKL